MTNKEYSAKNKYAPTFLITTVKILACVCFALCIWFFDMFSFSIGSITRTQCFLIGIAIMLGVVILYFKLTKHYKALWLQLSSLLLWILISAFLLTLNSVYNEKRAELLSRDIPGSGETSVRISLSADYYSTKGPKTLKDSSVYTPSMQINNQQVNNGCSTVDVKINREYTATIHAGLLGYHGQTTKDIVFTEEMLKDPTVFEVSVYISSEYSAVVKVTVEKSTSLIPFEVVFGKIT